jgi:hypothetical protein
MRIKVEQIVAEGKGHAQQISVKRRICFSEPRLSTRNGSGTKRFKKAIFQFKSIK